MRTRIPTDTPVRPRKATSVHLDIHYRQSPARVWKALTEAKSVGKWLLPVSGDIAPRVGHRFHFRGPEGERIACQVTEVVPGERLAYTWQTAPDQPLTNVVWTLEPTVSGGTRLTLQHSGGVTSPFPGGALALTACIGGSGFSAHHRPNFRPSYTRIPLRQGVLTCH